MTLVSSRDCRSSLLIPLALDLQDDVFVDMEDTELRPRIWVDAGDCVPHRCVEIGDSNEGRTRTNLLTQDIDLIHQLVEALLPFVVGEAERAAEDLTKTTNTDSLEERETFVVRFVGIVIHLDPRIQSPLVLAEVIGPYKALGLV